MQDPEYHEFLPPAPTDIPQQPIVSDTALGQVVLAANVCITAVIITAMLIDGTQARTAIIVGSAYFLVSTIAFAGVTTGALTSIVNAYQVQRTERQRVAAYLALGTMALHWRMEVERNRYVEQETLQPLRIPSAASVERLSPLTTFVAPYADERTAAIEGVAWAEKLYDRSAVGAPDPRKVHPDGRLRQRMIGSKRGGGSRESGVWLIRQGVIVRVSGGYRLALESYPFRHYVSALLRGRGGRWGGWRSGGEVGEYLSNTLPIRKNLNSKLHRN